MSLTKYHSLINNQFVSRESEEGTTSQDELYIPVVNPCTEEVIGLITQASEEQVRSAVQSTVNAFEGWKNTPVSERFVC